MRPGSGILDTIYEAKDRKIIRPTPDDVGHRQPAARSPGGRRRGPKYDEDFLNGFDDDGDGLVDEDFGQLGDQMFTCTMHDDTALSQEIYPEHQPLDVSVVQRAAAWYQEDLENMVILDFEIHNNGYRTLDDIYLGFYVDWDIQRRDDTTTGSDDLAGFYKGAVRSSDGAFQRIQLAWMRDAGQVRPPARLDRGHPSGPQDRFQRHTAPPADGRALVPDLRHQRPGQPERRTEIRRRPVRSDGPEPD